MAIEKVGVVGGVYPEFAEGAEGLVPRAAKGEI
jgi:hypothetical protein